MEVSPAAMDFKIKSISFQRRFMIRERSEHYHPSFLIQKNNPPFQRSAGSEDISSSLCSACTQDTVLFLYDHGNAHSCILPCLRQSMG